MCRHRAERPYGAPGVPANLLSYFGVVRLIWSFRRIRESSGTSDQAMDRWGTALMGRPSVDPRAQTARHWIGLEEASRLLGISATTLRRWSDAGLVETFVTPGGHRRFNGASVEALLPGALAHPTMRRLGETPERMSQVYRRASERRTLPWVDALDDSQRNAFRE